MKGKQQELFPEIVPPQEVSLREEPLVVLKGQQELFTDLTTLPSQEKGEPANLPSATTNDKTPDTEASEQDIVANLRAPKKPRKSKKKESDEIPKAISKRPSFYIIDGSNLAFRAFYAVQGLSNKQNLPTGALFGFCNMILRLLKEHQPDYLAVCWDPKGGTFRNDLYSEYKANRSEMPEDLRQQMPYFAILEKAFRIPHLVLDNYEADDLIATLTTQAKEECDVTIVTGDKDMMQLVEKDKVWQLDTMKNVLYTPKEVKEKWGVHPHQILDLLSIMGDSSDNIPGIKGIGEKGAVALLKQFKSLEKVFEQKDRVQGRAKKPLLAEDAQEKATLSKELATLVTDVDLEWSLEDCKMVFPPEDTSELRAFFQEMEFHRFLKELGGKLDSYRDFDFITVTEGYLFQSMLQEMKRSSIISIDTETTSVLPTQAELVGISICCDEKKAYYIPIAHVVQERSWIQIPLEQIIEEFQPLLLDPEKQWIGQNIKYDKIVLENAGFSFPKVSGDTMIADHLLNSGKNNHSLDDIALTALGYKMITYKDVTLDTKGDFAKVSIEKATQYAAEDAHAVFRAHSLLKTTLQERKLFDLYEKVELPLVSVLARMEKNGILIDCDLLGIYSEELRFQIEEVEQIVFRLAGREFNTASPKQLGEILFEELGLPVVKKTKTGASTDASVLEELALQHELPAAILRYRTLAKLKSTYVDALPPLVNPKTGRIHTSFNQTIVATGRLSSTNPNLQNIPVKTAEGRKIREAFVAPEGRVLISADYSQVELRVLAHLCGGKGGFAKAFAENKDLHRFTASEIFGVTEEEVSDEMRRTAKGINFGIVYGQSEFGLAKSLHIGRVEAKEYILRFKKQYPEIEDFFETTLEFARSNGYVDTILGRQRPITELDSSNFNQRTASERVAINSPVQGSAADIIKVAMIEIDKMMQEEFPKALLLLQVHDELVFEVDESEASEFMSRVVEKMETSTKLLVPLKVEARMGKTWNQIH